MLKYCGMELQQQVANSVRLCSLTSFLQPKDLKDSSKSKLMLGLLVIKRKLSLILILLHCHYFPSEAGPQSTDCFLVFSHVHFDNTM